MGNPWLVGLGAFAPLAALLAVVLSDTTRGWSLVIAPLTASVAAGVVAATQQQRPWLVAIATLVRAYVLWYPALVLALLIFGVAG